MSTTPQPARLSPGPVHGTAPVNALEDGFPFIELYPLAELESWRKEVNRPIYHVHKWWANRLGSVFRAIVLAGNLPAGADVWKEFYASAHCFRDAVVLDPFMGSGTTIGEALKLGCRVVGADINPVSYFQVRKAIEHCDEKTLWAAFERLKKNAAPRIQKFYKSFFGGIEADILYTFWVTVVACPDCKKPSRLFKKWIFSANAYPGRKPASRALCPQCGEINVVSYTDTSATCQSCAHHFNPQLGPADGQYFNCEHCSSRHQIADVVRQSSAVPQHEMYALMLLLPSGEKVYKRPDQTDIDIYAKSTKALKRMKLPVPLAEIPPGHNTNQARGYNYRFWYEMFNDRQLYCLATLLAEILKEPDRNVRECLLLLFSGVLEFNNMFCSFKGEGTGAVRHLFHHHILKPERTPLEANPWGTPKSSGSFSTLFERRLLRAKRYCADPFELRAFHQNGRVAGKKVYGVNQPLRPAMASDFEELATGKGDALLMATDSSRLPLPDNSVDLVVTDPPYFDNVHYSELADFFYCWLRLGLEEYDPAFSAATSRHEREVQGRDASGFGELLGAVFSECGRVLKPGGTLAFTFQHSRNDAWIAVANALQTAGLQVTATHPVKAEMSIAVPKRQAKNPINLDLIVVCRQRDPQLNKREPTTLAAIVAEVKDLVKRYNDAGIQVSNGDMRIILMGGLLKACTQDLHLDAQALIEDLAAKIETLCDQQRVRKTKKRKTKSPDVQLRISGI